jgi:DNA-binding XRE family transcriptional regulator
MLRKSNISGRPPWAKAIRALRQRLTLSQSALGARVGFSAMAVSRWERGAQEPPSHGYIAPGNLSRDENCWFFWERAGLRSEDVIRVLPTAQRNTRTSKLHNFEIVSAGSGPKNRSRKCN